MPVPIRASFGLVVVVLLLLPGVLLGQAPPGYYGAAAGLTGQELRAALHDIIDDHTVIPLNGGPFDTHDAIDLLQEDPGNPANVILVYSGFSVPKSSWPAYNREHLWPISLGAQEGTPAHSDIFNIYGCDMDVNAERGHKYFDECTGGCAIHPEAPECLYDFDSWEPRDVEKGDLARALFYMAVRYEGGAPGEPDLELQDLPPALGCGCMGLLTLLVAWHEDDPPDAVEMARNNVVFSQIQGNRNPFVDHPEWVLEIWGPGLELIRGDCSADGAILLNDAILLLSSLFSTATVPCTDACDANDDGFLNIADPLTVLFYLFASGAPPPPPFPGCGLDATPDGNGDLGCESFPACP